MAVTLQRALLLLAFLLAIALVGSVAHAQSCSIPGQAGTILNLTAQPNTFFPGTGSPIAGATSIAVGAGRGVNRDIQAGDMLLIIQMQGADINSTNTNAYGDNTSDAGTATVAFGAVGYAGGVNGTNFVAGNYEWAIATGGGSTFAAGGTINLSKGLTNAYFTRAGSVTQGKQAYQVIRVPQYANVTLTGGLTVLEWNGTTGGVLVMDATGDISMNGQVIDGNGRGFRGAAGEVVGPNGTCTGAYNTTGCPEYRATIAAALGGSKGEGSAGTPARIYTGDPTGAGTGARTLGTADGYVDGEAARGAPGNAGGGGNQHNAGGGGGGNGGAGGNGGNSWNSSVVTFVGLRLGGFGGSPSGNSAARWIMGGAGGAGDVGGNTYVSPDASGGAGGALVILRASRVVGGTTSAINVNGAPGQRSRNTDAAGGGGAGGTVVMALGTGGVSGAMAINANGGAGGAYQVAAAEQDGSGGGGGGGVLIHNIATGTVTFNATGGAAGASSSNACPPTVPAADCGQRAGSTTSGLTGYAITSPGLQVGYECLPNLTVNKATSTPLISSATGATAAYTINVSNSGGGARFVSVRDFNLPPGWTILGTPTATFTLDPATPLAADRLSSIFESTAIAHTLAWTAGASPQLNPAAGANSLNWSHFAIAPVKNGVPGSITVSFVVSIPDTATASTYHNGAGITYLDPARTATSVQTISPSTNNTAKRDGVSYGTTTYFNFNGLSSVSVGGANYNGLDTGPTAEDVTLLADLRLTKSTTTASVVAGRTTNFVLVATNLGRPLGSVTFATDQATTGSGTATAGNPMAFTDNLQTGLSLAASPTDSSANWSCTGGAGSTTFTCSAAPTAYPIASGATMVTVTATVNTTPGACPGPLILNTATLALATIGESNSANNTATTSLSISCTTNMSITKTNAVTTLSAGQSTTYTITISVAAGATVSSADGAVARDTPSAGLSNCTVTSCTPSGSPIATCPLAANWPNFLNGTGLPIPGLPAGSSVALTVQCGVTATGL